MSKQVLVIENEKDFDRAVNRLVDGGINVELPSKLLAEFKAEVVDLGTMGKDLAIADEDMEKLENGKKYYVLILEEK